MQYHLLDFYAKAEGHCGIFLQAHETVQELPVPRLGSEWLWKAAPLSAALMKVRCPLREPTAPSGDGGLLRTAALQLRALAGRAPVAGRAWRMPDLASLDPRPPSFGQGLLEPSRLEALVSQSQAWLLKHRAEAMAPAAPDRRGQPELDRVPAANRMEEEDVDKDCEWLNRLAEDLRSSPPTPEFEVRLEMSSPLMPRPAPAMATAEVPEVRLEAANLPPPAPQMATPSEVPGVRLETSTPQRVQPPPSTPEAEPVVLEMSNLLPPAAPMSAPPENHAEQAADPPPDADCGAEALPATKASSAEPKLAEPELSAAWPLDPLESGGVPTLDLAKLGTEPLPSISDLSELLPTAGQREEVHDGHLRFQCSSAVGEAVLGACWKLGDEAEEIPEMPLPDESRLPGLELTEDIAPLLSRDSLQFPKAPEPWATEAVVGEALEERVKRCASSTDPVAKSSWRQSPFDRQMERWMGSSAWEAEQASSPSWRKGSAFQERFIVDHTKQLLCDPGPGASAAAAVAVVPNATAEVAELYSYTPSAQESALAEQLENGASLTWLAYRNRLPELVPPLDEGALAVVSEELPSLTDLQKLLLEHEQRHGRMDEQESAQLEGSIYRLLFALHVLILLRRQLMDSGLLQTLFCAIEVVAPSQIPNVLLRHNLFVTNSLAACHDFLRLSQGGQASRPPKANDLCVFVGCQGCHVASDKLCSLEALRVEALKALRRRAIEQQRRLVVVFASQKLLEAFAAIIGADCSGKVASKAEVVAVAALTPPTKCEQLLRRSATALVHETALIFHGKVASVEQSAEIVAAWEVRHLMKQSVVVAYQKLLLDAAESLAHFRLAPQARPEPPPAPAPAEAAPAAEQLVAPGEAAPPSPLGFPARAAAEPPAQTGPLAAEGPCAAAAQSTPTVIVGAHLLHAQALLRDLEARGLRLLEREVLADSDPDFLLGPRFCVFLRSLHVIVGQQQELCERIQRSLQSFDEVLLILVSDSEPPKGDTALERFGAALPRPGRGKALRSSFVPSEGLVEFIMQEAEHAERTGRGLDPSLKVSEADELHFVAALPGLNVALAEAAGSAWQRGAGALVAALGLQLPAVLQRQMQEAIDAKLATTSSGPGHGPGKDLPTFISAVRAPGWPGSVGTKRSPRWPDEDEQELRTPLPPPSQRPRKMEPEPMTPPDRILAPARARPSAARSLESHLVEAKEQLWSPPERFGEDMRHMQSIPKHRPMAYDEGLDDPRETSRRQRPYPQPGRYSPGPAPLAGLPQKRRFHEETEGPRFFPARQERPLTLTAGRADESSYSRPCRPSGTLRGAQMIKSDTRGWASRSSLFGSLCPEPSRLGPGHARWG